MPTSQAAAASERRNDRMTTHEPPKLKTTLKTPPKQATNPLQFVKVGPCSLYRTAQEQLQKVQEVKKIKQEVRDDPEDWQSNLDNWKSSRRKRQEHIIERVVEVKKLELEEHDRQRRRSKTFSEMMEERGNRGRKLSISLAMYQEEDANDLSDLGIGTSSGKSSVSGDTHDDAHSVLSDRDSEIEKNHSDVDSCSVARENGSSSDSKIATKKSSFGSNGFHCSSRSHQEYDSATTATASSPEPEEYTYEGAIRGYVSRVAQNIPRRSSLLVNLDGSTKSSSNEDTKGSPATKTDVLKRREMFEKASQKGAETKANRLSGDFANAKTIKERLSNLEKQKHETTTTTTTTTTATMADSSVEKSGGKALNRLSGDMSSIRERLSHLEKQTSERESKNSARKQLSTDELETVRPLRERLSTLEKYSSSDESSVLGTNHEQPPRHNGELTAKTIKDRLSALDAAARNKEVEKKRCASLAKHELCFGRDAETRIETSTPSERSSSPDSEYRVPRAAFHRSLDSLDADASSGPDTFERVQSLEELDYTRRYQASFSSAELLNDTDREDSGIHTGDVSCSVSQADEPVDEEIVHSSTIVERREVMTEEKVGFTQVNEVRVRETIEEMKLDTSDTSAITLNGRPAEAVVTKKETAETSSGELSTNKSHPQPSVEVTNTNALRSPVSSSRPVVYQSPKVPPRRSPPELLKPKSVDASSTIIDPLPAIKLPDESESCIANPEVSISSDQSARGNVVVDPMLVESSERRNARTSIVSTLTSESIPKHSSPITAPPSPIVARAESNIASSSPSVIQESKASGQSPQTARSASKIPTPLPRKSVSNKSSATTSSSSIPQPKTSSLKPRTCPSKSQATTSSSSPQLPKTVIPSPSEVTSSSVTAAALEVTVIQETRPADRRHTVVEVCEKVVVPQGEAPPTPPVTPFITVARVGDDDSSEESLVVDKSIIEEPIREITSLEESQIVRGPTNVELELTMQNNNSNKKKKKKDEGPKATVEPEDRRQSMIPLVDHSSPSTPERPSTLTLEKSTPTFNTMEILSPLSPMSKQILPLNLSSDEEIVTGLAFPLGPPTSVEPPKEKPPPPPVDLSDEENLPTESLKRLNSTRRIKKEIRSRRSDFLGIEGINDDELERELTLTKPPDMAAILAEERRIEQLHRRSYDTDSNYEQDSSHERDSGVELGHAEDWTKQAVSPDMSQHSRQSSEPFGASVTSSEEDEITKKEREIIEVLEKEEQWRYANNRELDSNDIGEKLAHKLRELEEEKMQLERERAQEMELRRQEETLRKNEENIRKQEEILRQQQEEAARQQEVARVDAERQAEARRLEEKKRQEELRIQAEQLRIQSEIEEKERRAADVRHREEMRIRAIENQIREQENNALVGAGLSNREGEFASGEVLRVERELLQLEQEELKRQRNNLAYREHKQQQLAEQLQEQWKSLQDVAHGSTSNVQQQLKQQPPPMNYRSSMPNLQLQDGQRRRPPPPPIPPAKPLRLVEQRQRDVTIRNSRIPSADSIPQQVDASLRHSASATALATHGGQQMTRQTLQALSAAPRPRIVQGDQWVQRRKSDVPRSAQDFNYQHWLIQEAEQRRINEKNQRSPRKVHVTGTSVPYTASPPRSDSKPLPDSIIQTLTQRVQNRTQEKPLPLRRRLEQSTSQEHLPTVQQQPQQQHIIQQQKVLQPSAANNADSQEKMLSVSGKNKCSHCGDELGRGAAMIIECLRLFYHMECFKCCVCHVRLGDGLMGTDVRVRNHKLHCHNCYSSDDGVKFSCV